MTIEAWWRIGWTETPAGIVSTVLLGEGAQYETMIFESEWYENFYCRYDTESEARAGHRDIVTALQEGRRPE